MFNFYLKQTKIFQAVKWGENPLFAHAKILRISFFTIFIISFSFFLPSFLAEILDDISLARLFGVSLLSFILAVFFELLISFFTLKLARPFLGFSLLEAAKNPEKFNLAEYLGFPAARAVFRALKFAEENNTAKVDSTSLFYFLLRGDSGLKFIFYRAGLDFKKIKRRLRDDLGELVVLSEKNARKTGATKEPVFSKNFQNSLLEAIAVAAENNHRRIEAGDILFGLAKHNSAFKDILSLNKLRARDMESLALWLAKIRKKTRERRRWWDYKNLIKRGSLGRDWAAGFTLTLDVYSIDWSKIMRRRSFPEIIGHGNQIKAVERILSRGKLNNVLIVGEPGTGRKSVVSAVSIKSALGRSSSKLNYKRIVELDLPLLVSRFESAEKVEAVLNEIFEEVAAAGNVILVIDDFHNFVGGRERPGVVDISGILSSFLRLPQFQIVAITTYAGLHKEIERRPGILSLFAKVEVFELSEKDTIALLRSQIPYIEKKHKVFVLFQAIREAVSLSDRYLTDLFFPQKAVDVLEEAAVYAASEKRIVVTEKDVVDVISEKSQIPLGDIEVKEKNILLNLEELIHRRIVNQDIAVKEISSALRRARAEIKEARKPMGTFLFLGPTGVGKTETAKALADIYFGSAKKIIRLDMSEFQQIKDVSRLIGSADEKGILTTKVREDPFSLVLLDEIEKAHPNILNLFLQVLDEGRLTDWSGRVVDFRNTIVIATSNAGYQIILDAIKEKKEWGALKERLFNHLFERGVFRPEFINRFDGVVLFNTLTKKHLLEIAELQLCDVKNGLAKKDVEFVITEPLKEKIVELGYSPQFGAREMKRVIQDKVENAFAKGLLGEEIIRGDKVEIDSSTFEIIKKIQ